MRIAFTTTIKYRNLPIPFISFSRIEQIETVQSAPEAEILPIPAPAPATHVSDGRAYPDVRTYHPDKRYRRGTGPLVGTERYRAIHVRRDLIQWFIDRKNRPLTETQMRTMKKSPFRHAWVKCEITCDHRIVSDATLRRVLRNEAIAKEQTEGTTPVITFARVKKKKATFTLDKDFYKSLNKETAMLDVPQWEQAPPDQIPAGTETVDSVSHSDILRSYIRENSDIRR